MRFEKMSKVGNPVRSTYTLQNTYVCQTLYLLALYFQMHFDPTKIMYATFTFPENLLHNLIKNTFFVKYFHNFNWKNQ